MSRNPYINYNEFEIKILVNFNTSIFNKCINDKKILLNKIIMKIVEKVIKANWFLTMAATNENNFFAIFFSHILISDGKQISKKILECILMYPDL